MAKSNDYWIKRQESLQRSLLEPTDKYIEELENAYTQAIKSIEKDIAVWYQRFADNNVVSIADAKKILNAKELKELKWDVNRYIKAGKENGITANWSKELENASARVHISRLEALKIQTQEKIEELYGGREDKVRKLLGDAYTEGSYKNAYEIAQKTGANFTFAKIDDNKLNKVLSKPWTVDERTFSDRVWVDRAKLVNTLHNELTKGIIRGDSVINMARAISEKMGSDLKSAQRLVLTESAFFASEAQRDTYKILEVDKYEIIGTLDSITCSECGGYDGKVYDAKDMQAGVNAPPFHPRCRCTTAPYFDDEFTTNIKRAARDKEGKTTYIKDMPYKDWKEKFVSNDQFTNSSKSVKIKSDKIVGSGQSRANQIKTKNIIQKGIAEDKILADDANKKVQNYKLVELSEEKTDINRKGKEIIIHKVISARNDIYVSENVKLKPKQLHNIDSNISKAIKMLDVNNGDLPRVYIINTNEMCSGALASYNPVKNIIFFDGKIGIKKEALNLQNEFACGNDIVSTYLHEYIHWKDCNEYRSKYGDISTSEEYDKYISWLNNKCKKELDKLAEKGYNIGEISKYASESFKDGDYAETYTEFKVVKYLKGVD